MQNTGVYTQPLKGSEFSFLFVLEWIKKALKDLLRLPTYYSINGWRGSEIYYGHRHPRYAPISQDGSWTSSILTLSPVPHPRLSNSRIYSNKLKKTLAKGQNGTYPLQRRKMEIAGWVCKVMPLRPLFKVLLFSFCK